MNNRLITVLVCPNAFKGSLSSVDAARSITAGIERAGKSFQQGSELECLRLVVEQAPLADGGDGTLETLVGATTGSIHVAAVRGPLGDRVIAPWGRLGKDQCDTAVIEMAKASGLGLLSPDKLNPLTSSTFGTGELMLAAIRNGCTKLLIGIGGSATNDGGAGMATALGARLLDANGAVIPLGGVGLEQLAAIDMSGWKLPAHIKVVAVCDVDNPLTGRLGASAIYGPQKGATPEMVGRLDAALQRYAAVLQTTFGLDVSTVPGAGAAGGLGAGLLAFCGGSLMPGSEMVLDVVRFDKRLHECDLVITGEGKLDGQTARGKVIAVVARRALSAGKPCIALVGTIAESADETLASEGLTSAFSIVNGPMDLDTAMTDGAILLSGVAERVMRLIISGVR